MIAIKIAGIKRIHAKITTLYLIRLIDRRGCDVQLEFRYNRKDKMYRPLKTYVDGVCHDGKLRFLLDNNGLYEENTDTFIEKIAKRADELLSRKAARKIVV